MDEPRRSVRDALNFDRLPYGAQLELIRQGWVPTAADYDTHYVYAHERPSRGRQRGKSE